MDKKGCARATAVQQSGGSEAVFCAKVKGSRPGMGSKPRPGDGQGIDVFAGAPGVGAQQPFPLEAETLVKGDGAGVVGIDVELQPREVPPAVREVDDGGHQGG